MTSFRLKVVAAAVALLACQSQPAWAMDRRIITNTLGQPFFEMAFADIADSQPGVPFQTLREWEAGEKDRIVIGMQYWANIIKMMPGRSLPFFAVFANNDFSNASAGSPLVPGLAIAPTLIGGAIQGVSGNAEEESRLGVINMGPTPYTYPDFLPSQTPVDPKGDIYATVSHEVAHALGIAASVESGQLNHSDPYSPSFSTHINTFTTHLYDDNGKQAKAGQTIWCQPCVNPASDDVFDVRSNKAYFWGEHVGEVLAGSGLRGVPLSTGPAPYAIDWGILSHLELKNSQMSHQRYRNYTGFMEAELALLQDIGYTIDRRNFFGYSVYGDNITMTNDNGYFLRNADGTAYIPGHANTAMLGLGLHVYGSYNTIRQRADLLSVGAGGAGIRVDGVGNTIDILPGTRVVADGYNGRGVMFTYGKNHTLVQRGDVQALGALGVAASFDFGQNMLGLVTPVTEFETRGSYTRVVNGVVSSDLLGELDGPLVTQFDLTGRLAGTAAAIAISDNAYVGQINIMRGASLQGDIRSAYSAVDDFGVRRVTDITFGRLADSDGRATSAADSDFELRYSGNIIGINNLALRFVGGETTLNGNHEILSASVEAGAQLGGTSQYRLASGGVFSNAGTITTVDGKIGITGNYAQLTGGRLVVGLTGQVVNGLNVSGDAALAGMLEIAPQQAWYARDYSLTTNNWITASSITGAFDSVYTQLDSPTLIATATALGGIDASISITRRAAAYSRYATDANGRSVGLVLDQVAGNAAEGLQPLVAALDFSDADGSTIARALDQLSPASYGEMFAGSLLRERQITELVVSGAGQADGQEGDASARRAFAVPFGSGYRRSHKGDTVGSNGNTYGVVIGGRLLGGAGSPWSLGVHGAVSGQSLRTDNSAPGSGSGTAMDVGVHARYMPDPRAGAHAFALVQAGVESSRFERTVTIEGETERARASWTGTTAAASVGGGWRWQLGQGDASLGVIGALDYNLLHRPGVSEGGDSVRLNLAGQTLHSLRSRLGAEWRMTPGSNAAAPLSALVQATWNHELLDPSSVQQAAFADAPTARMEGRSSVVRRDSLSLRAGLGYRTATGTLVQTSLGSTAWRGGGVDISGALSVNWTF